MYSASQCQFTQLDTRYMVVLVVLNQNRGNFVNTLFACNRKIKSPQKYTLLVLFLLVQFAHDQKPSPQQEMEAMQRGVNLSRPNNISVEWTSGMRVEDQLQRTGNYLGGLTSKVIEWITLYSHLESGCGCLLCSTMHTRV